MATKVKYIINKIVGICRLNSKTATNISVTTKVILRNNVISFL